MKIFTFWLLFAALNFGGYMLNVTVFQNPTIWWLVLLLVPAQIAANIFLFNSKLYTTMKNSFNSLFTILALFALFGFSSCAGCNRPEPNFEGVLMTECGKNNLESFKVVSGAQGPLGWCSKLYQVPMFEQKADPPQIEVTSKDGGAFKVDPTYMYQAIRGKGPEIIFNYKHVNVEDKTGMMDNIEENILNPVVLNAYREEARNYSTNELLNNLAQYERAVEQRLQKEFTEKYFEILTLTSGLKPPESMIKSIEERNNAVTQGEMVKNALEISRQKLEQAKIDAQADIERSKGLTKEILQLRWIEMLEKTNNKIIVTDGSSPVIIQK